MGIIDIHCHAFPDSLAPRAIAALTSAGEWTSVGDGTTTGLLASMDAAGIEASVLCPIATKPSMFDGICGWLASLESPRLIPFGSIHPNDEDRPGLVARLAETGIRGVKMHAFYQDFCVDDPQMDDYYAALAEHDMLIQFHAGHDIAFEEDAILDRSAPHRIAAVLDRHPTLKVLATHTGGWKVWDEVREHLLGRRVLLETSYTTPFLPADQHAELIRAHGLDNVAFGTDWPWMDQAAELETLRGLGLTDDEFRQVTEHTAAAWLGL
ncbi:MAG: amidohydrolase family protein [Phycisphaerales bacterium]|jgi:uncharacterized protein|nr:amidohydrolase family protein [Phycisphaerales bacterium]